jgi:hypothetical protein
MRPHSAVHSRLTAAPARPARRPQTAFPAAGRDVELVVNANASGAGEAADVVGGGPPPPRPPRTVWQFYRRGSGRGSGMPDAASGVEAGRHQWAPTSSVG